MGFSKMYPFYSTLIIYMGIILSSTRVYAQEQALEVEPRNRNFSSSVTNNSPFNIFGRQSGCYAPDRYCPLYNRCCSSRALGCCPGECTLEVPNDCCLDGGYCATGKLCCGDGCMPTGSECCIDGRYCPYPLICVLVSGISRPVCCTDLSCRVYLSDGVTRTATSTRRVITTDAPTYQPDVATSARYTYYSTCYWTYWYYYYTIYYYARYATYTIDAVITTVTRTTTLTAYASDSAYGEKILLGQSSALSLYTPTNAYVTIPPTPTSGAILVGNCTGTTDVVVTESLDFETYTTPVSLCETLFASETTSSSSRSSTTRRTSTAASTTQFGSANGGDAPSASGAVTSVHAENIVWLFLIAVPLFIGSLLFVL